MKAETCCFCKVEIPAGACQQSQRVDEEWFPLHVGCAEAWVNEAIPVWTIEHCDYGYTTAAVGDVECEIAELEHEQSITVTRRSMARLEYLKLPEADP